MKTFLRTTLKLLLYSANHSELPRGTRILFYHSIDDTGSPISTSVGAFRQQMAYLKSKGFKTLVLSDYLREMTRLGRPPDRSVCITFDDGFENNYSQALPILREHDFTATIFLTTDYVDGRATWIDRDFAIISKRMFGASQRSHLLEGLRKAAALPLLTWHQARQLSACGMEIGSHTGSHPWLNDISTVDGRLDILRSLRMIEDQISKPAELFSYPYGDITPRVKELVRSLGLFAACAATLVSREQDLDLFELRRVSPYPPDSFFDFKFLLTAGFDFYSKLKTLTDRRIAGTPVPTP